MQRIYYVKYKLGYVKFWTEKFKVNWAILEIDLEQIHIKSNWAKLPLHFNADLQICSHQGGWAENMFIHGKYGRAGTINILCISHAYVAGSQRCQDFLLFKTIQLHAEFVHLQPQWSGKTNSMCKCRSFLYVIYF